MYTPEVLNSHTGEPLKHILALYTFSYLSYFTTTLLPFEVNRSSFKEFGAENFQCPDYKPSETKQSAPLWHDYSEVLSWVQ